MSFDKHRPETFPAFGHRLTPAGAFDFGVSPLMAACSNNDEEELERLTREETNINRQDANGFAALHHAVAANNVAGTKLLLTRGADPNLRDRYGCAAISIAARSGDSASVRCLLAGGANTNTASHSNGITPVMEASAGGFLSVVELLARAGADVDARAADDETAWHMAKKRCHPSVCAYLDSIR